MGLNQELLSAAEEIAQLARPYATGVYGKAITSCANAVRRYALMLQLDATYPNETGLGQQRLTSEMKDALKALVKVCKPGSPEANLFASVLVRFERIVYVNDEAPF
jgi:hypothetical protein